MLSIDCLRFSRRTPPAMSTRSASMVVKRSSSNTTGTSVFCFNSSTKRRVFSVCTESVPSKLTGRPQTISPASFSRTIFASASASVSALFVRKYVSPGRAKVLKGSLAAMPILLSPISNAIIRFSILTPVFLRRETRKLPATLSVYHIPAPPSTIFRKKTDGWQKFPLFFT